MIDAKPSALYFVGVDTDERWAGGDVQVAAVMGMKWIINRRADGQRKHRRLKQHGGFTSGRC